MSEARVALAARKYVQARNELDAAIEELNNGRADRWQQLLTMVEKAGRTVTGKEWRDMGRACGYDPRGLGGFYVGSKPTMVKNADGTRTLTDQGVAYLDQYGRA
jgi:membrane carboxypeptidase/penicillin-binding protein